MLVSQVAMVAVAMLVSPRYGQYGGSAAGTPNFATSNSSGVAKIHNRVRFTHPCMLCAVAAFVLLFACIGDMLQQSPQSVASS